MKKKKAPRKWIYHIEDIRIDKGKSLIGSDENTSQKQKRMEKIGQGREGGF